METKPVVTQDLDVNIFFNVLNTDYLTLLPVPQAKGFTCISVQKEEVLLVINCWSSLHLNKERMTRDF